MATALIVASGGAAQAEDVCAACAGLPKEMVKNILKRKALSDALDTASAEEQSVYDSTRKALDIIYDQRIKATGGVQDAVRKLLKTAIYPKVCNQPKMGIYISDDNPSPRSPYAFHKTIVVSCYDTNRRRVLATYKMTKTDYWWEVEKR